MLTVTAGLPLSRSRSARVEAHRAQHCPPPRWRGALALALTLPLLLPLGCTPSRGRPGPGKGQAGPPAGAGQQPDHALISGFIVNPASGGGAVAIRVANPGAAPLDLAGFSLTDELGARAAKLRARGAPGRRDLVFPSGSPATLLQPGQEVWVARDAAEFAKEFGQPPDFEMGDDALFPANDPAVPDMSFLGPAGKRGAWLQLSPRGSAILALCGPERSFGRSALHDVVPYNFSSGKSADPSRPSLRKLRDYEEGLELPAGSLWRGAPLMTATNLFLPSPPFSPNSRVYSRDRDAFGQLLEDSDRAQDWDAGASSSRLGDDPVHRVWAAGQSAFTFGPRAGEADVTLTASPESNYAELLRAFAAAQRSIKVSIYYFKQVEIAAALVEAIRRGVDVEVYMEGSVVGVRNGFSDQERYVAKLVEDAGRERSGQSGHGLGRAYWIRSDPALHIDDRYTYDHSKYVIIDERSIVVGSENYGSTGHSLDPSHGNRGWEVHLATPPGQPTLGVVEDLLAVWRDDVDPTHHADVIRYSDDPATLDETGRGRYGPPPRDFEPHGGPVYGRYVPRTPLSEQFREPITAELIASPDTSLREQGAILGAIAEAKHTLLVEHLSFATYWGGKKSGSAETTPNLLLEACVQAARRGVKVRILLNCRSFGCDRPDARWEGNRTDNDDVYETLRRLAQRENLDLEVRLLDMTSDDWMDDREDQGTEKIHNKGLIIDSELTLFSSINGVENSFKANREIAVLLRSRRAARFYERLFWYDWTTVLEPERVEVLAGVGAELEPSLQADPRTTGVVLTGLKPKTQYFLRVSALDSDDTDFENTLPPTPMGPHESALSDELAALSTPEGTLALRWERNRSECLEGDLAGYRVYYGERSAPGTLSADDARRAGHYQGVGARQGPSPVAVPLHPERPQCQDLLQAQARRDPPVRPECWRLTERVEACYAEADQIFPELRSVLQRTGPPGSERWERSMDALRRACSAPPVDSAKVWEAERLCVQTPDCPSLWTCLRQAEEAHHPQILRAPGKASPFKKKDRKRRGRRGRPTAALEPRAAGGRQ